MLPPEDTLSKSVVTKDLEAIVRDYAFALVGKIEETNKAMRKTGGHQFEIGRSCAYSLSLFMLLNRLERSGANLCEMGLCRINPLALIEPAPKEPEPPPRKRRPYGRRGRY